MLAQITLVQATFQNVEISEYAHSYYDKKEDVLFAFIPGLENDLFKQFKLKDTRGPKWQKLAMKSLSRKTDFDHRSSYFGESYDGQCANYFTDPQFGPTETDEVYAAFEWKAVKNISGSQKSVMYIVEYYTQVVGDKEFEGSRECNILEDEYVFLNKLDSEGQPIFLGRRSFKLPR
jgi:hypothetical protein